MAAAAQLMPLGGHTSATQCNKWMVVGAPLSSTDGIQTGISLSEPAVSGGACISSAVLTPPGSPLLALDTKTLTNCKNDNISESTTKQGLYNLLHVSTRNSDRYFISRQCCYIFHCLNLKVNFTYPFISNKVVLKDKRVKAAIDHAISEQLEEQGMDNPFSDKMHSTFIARQILRAGHLVTDMKAAISTVLIRFTGYVLFKVFSRLLMSVTVHWGQLEMIKAAAKKDRPLIFVPLHRSHVDYLFVTWVLFNCEIPAPIVAAGDNLLIPIFGCLLRGLGGFFIKRKLESTKAQKDIVYRAVLQTYITHALQAGYNLEFFIEGGRTRTGKPCHPKGGLLSVIVDAYMNGTLDDALIIPIAINYDRLMDGNFIREQLGQSKVPESFWGAVRAILTVFSTNFGHTRIDFAQPFSLREFIQNSNIPLTFLVNSHNHSSSPPLPPSPPNLSISTDGPVKSRSMSVPVITSSHWSLDRTAFASSESAVEMELQPVRSCSSLFGAEVTDEYRDLIRTLGEHIVIDAERSQAIMSTNAVGWLLSFAFREGVSLSVLSKALDTLRENLRTRGRDVGFSGTSRAVVIHAINMLGPTLVKTDLSACSASMSEEDCDVITVQPVTFLPNVIELNYYANALTPVFAVDSIVATAVMTCLDCNIWDYKDCHVDLKVSQDKITAKAVRLSQILSREFLFVPVCSNIDKRIQDSIDRLVCIGLLSDAENFRGCYPVVSDWGSSDSDEDLILKKSYNVKPDCHALEVVDVWVRMLTPLLDTYFVSASCLRQLIDREVSDGVFVREIQTVLRKDLERGNLAFGESLAADPVRNALRFFQSEGVLEIYACDSVNLVYLCPPYNSEEKLMGLIQEINSFRV